ncbi:alpha/beta hydrolase [Aquabacter sp. P-9]|uniref:alpha/beta hydrolase n=1 Tax=Aquabacter sediminis TaxID=3029197 RepID=UPI00237EC748|nr:alpha/beta fold hydrolase [Aquabacter sp. P-9]MDE1569858.1 alpha/beta fold hydrolase [Aquabacter sp. P-9]
MGFVFRQVRRLLVLLVVLTALALVGRGFLARMEPPLEAWHTFAPTELTREELGKADWPAYLAREAKLMEEIRTHVADQLSPAARVPGNRYFADSPIYPPHFAQDWNRSFVIEPQGPVKGVAVFLHGLTDSPYSLRHFANLYAQRGFVALGIRLPAHGTTPAALKSAEWEDFMAATRLVMREAKRRAGGTLPVHVAGYSNGAALALMYALDALDDPTLVKPARLVLVSPMVGVTPYARFAPLAGWPAVLPFFAQSAWLSILPEFNPFKYNSFPVNGGYQSWRLTQALRDNIARHLKSGRLEGLPPVLTFQSLLDHTVVAQDMVDGLYGHLPDNGSELVLFDVNRLAQLNNFLSIIALDAAEALLPPGPRPYRTTIITNSAPDTLTASARITEAGQTTAREAPLGLAFPPEVYSLSHIAVPFPLQDGLYGLQPEPGDNFGISLGTAAGRGEFSALTIPLIMVMRMSSNPFFPYVLQKVGEGLPSAQP